MNSGLRSGCAQAQLKLARGYEGRDLRACQMVKGQDIDRSLTLYEAAAKTSAEAQLVLAVHFEGLRSARFYATPPLFFKKKIGGMEKSPFPR